uniref:Eukaryotic translation initiation factor 3 subunit H n=1 Tax=Palpitomonas bilix TaxID=652834 RepID=A0A7S3CUW3_9EUKA
MSDYAKRLKQEVQQDLAPREVPIVTSVTLDGIALMKILSHAKEATPSNPVTGGLLGLDEKHVLQVTNCFPFPNRDIGEDEDGADYQMDMMRLLREVNVDNNTVGWYQTAFMGSFISESLIETQFSYQENLTNSVCIIFDPMRSACGDLSIRAFRLTDSFMALYKSGEFTLSKIQELNVKHSDIFTELPIRISNPCLTRALIAELAAGEDPRFEADGLKVNTSKYVERTLGNLCDAMDEYEGETRKFRQWAHNTQKQQARQTQYLEERKAKDAIRKQQGLEPLPEEDTSLNPIFKPVPEPKRLDSLLLTGQMDLYCQQIDRLAGEGLGKTLMHDSLLRNE